MVHSPEDALRTFFGSGLDVLVMEKFLVKKTENEQVKIKDVRLELD
jgi:hypothetical protein